MNSNSIGADLTEDTDDAGIGEAGVTDASTGCPFPADTVRDVSTVPASAGDAVDGDGWLADETLFPNRPPISSHRIPRAPRRPFLVSALVLIIGAVGWIWIAGAGRSVPPALIAPPLNAVGAVDPAGTVDSSIGPGGAEPVPTASATAVLRTSAPSKPVRSAAPPARTSTAADPPAGTPVTGARSTAPPVRTVPPVAPKPTPAPTPTAAPVTDPAAGMIVRVVSAVSHAWISVSGDSVSDGALIVTTTVSSAGSRWQLAQGVNGCLQLINVHSGKALDNPDSNNDNGTQMQQWGWGTTNPNQTWCLRSVGSARFSIQNDASRSLLYLPAGGGTAVQEWATDPASPTINETWTMVPAS